MCGLFLRANSKNSLQLLRTSLFSCVCVDDMYVRMDGEEEKWKSGVAYSSSDLRAQEACLLWCRVLRIARSSAVIVVVVVVFGCLDGFVVCEALWSLAAW